MKRLERQIRELVGQLPEPQSSPEHMSPDTRGFGRWQKIGVVLLAAVLCCGITLTASASIRERVFHFFRSTDSEKIPDPLNETENTAAVRVQRSQIQDVADIYYYHLKNAGVMGDMMVVEEENDRQYYALTDDGAVLLSPSVQTVETTLSVDGDSIPLRFELLSIGGKRYLNDMAEAPDDVTAEAIWVADDTHVWVQVVDRTQLVQRLSLYLYDFAADAVDVALDDLLPANFQIETVSFSSYDGAMLIKEFSGGYDTGRYVYVSPEQKVVADVSDMTGLGSLVTCSFAAEDQIAVSVPENGAAAGFLYDVEKRTLSQLYSGSDRVVYTNGAVAIVDKGDYYEIVSSEEDGVARLENCSLEGLEFLSNADKTKIAVCRRDQESASGLSVSELGVIDLNTLEFKIFERENAQDNPEYDIGWDSADNLIIHTDTVQYRYVFHTK